MATAPKAVPADNRATSRTVVLLRATDRKKLERMAKQERVSAGEIVRRSLESYESLETRIRKEEEDKVIRAAIGIMEECLSAANGSIAETIGKLDLLHEELKKRDLR